MRFLQFFFVIVFLWLLPTNTFALSTDGSRFINIVNPVRISSYTKDPVASLNAQYAEISSRNIPATWLLTFDVISNNEMVWAARQMDEGQELGLFLEITPLLAQQANVTYNKTDSWHRANSLFLSGYTQEDRKKMVDTLFNKFKEEFGYYPSSVGSWWSDSFSLGYMREKYGITTNLTCADQFETDGYHLWGQYWGAPFYPSKLHAGIPAKDVNSKIDVVTIQWAPRDPLNGYRSSAYSSQDYFVLGFNQDYFEKLIEIYAGSSENEFGQIAFGLEGDLDASSYKGIYAQEMDLVSRLQNSGKYQVATMKDFSNWYRSNFKEKTPDFSIISDDLLNTGQKAIWYQSPNYRIGFVYNDKEHKLAIIDLRTYFNNFQEPFYLTPNFQIDLFINIPSVIDAVNNPQSKWEMEGLKLKSVEKIEDSLYLYFEDDKIIRLNNGSINFTNFSLQQNLPVIVKDSPKLDFEAEGNNFAILPKTIYPYDSEGYTFRDLSIEATYFLWRPKVKIIGVSAFLLIAVASFWVVISMKKKRKFKIKLLGSFYLLISVIGIYLFLTNAQIYSVNQSEIDALDNLAALPDGKVAVFKGGCLICKWYTKYPPAAFANKKDYVSKLSKKPIVYNSSVFQAKSRPEGKKELDKLGVKYIYVVRYERYLEEVPFSPGDLNIEKIYENAHSQIWRVKS